MQDEQRIVELYWARAETAIAETQKVYGGYVYAIAYRLLGNEEDAREIANDTYLKAWNLIPPQRPALLRTFLGRIARQLSINRLEHATAKKRGAGEYTYVLEELQGYIPSSQEDFVDTLVLRDTLERFLRTLSADSRRIFLQRYWYMCPIAEIARQCSMSESAVKMQLLRTREKLREFLQKEKAIV